MCGLFLAAHSCIATAVSIVTYVTARRTALWELVGAARFELATTCTPCRYATRLRYAPKGLILTLQLIENGAQFALDRRDVDAAPRRTRTVAGGHRLMLFFLPPVAVVPRVVEAGASTAG